jgi:CheY-like chemotaxis protein/signal transduction histidine kinase
MTSPVQLPSFAGLKAMLGALPEPAMIIHLPSQRIAAANSLATSLAPSTATLADTDASRLRGDRDRAALAAALRKLATGIDGACATIDETLLGSDPGGLLVRSEFRAFQVDGERYALHVFREIAPSTTAERTRVQELEQELRALRETAELDARRKGEFYASLSRELRNPLTSILGYLDLIADPESPERERPVWLGQIRKSGESLMGLVQDLVDLGQMEAGTFKLESDSFSTSLALAHVLSQARARAQHQGRDVIARYTTPVPRTLTLDPVRFRQCLSTLIHFVIENTSKGDVTLQTAVIGNGEERRLAFDVSAFCRELDHSDLDPLFDPFRPTTLRARPWSLAFPVARRLSEMMGGTIEWGLDADRVWLRLTIRPTQVDFVHMAHLSLPDERETPPSTHPPVRLRGTVLLVEDSESDRLLVAKILERSGLQVDFVSCGAEALERPVQRYDAILMDVELPDMDGLETTRRLRAAGATVPIIALTASVLVGDRERCLDAGCTAYVTKPIDRPMLLRTLDGLISTTEDRRVMSVLPPEMVLVEPLPSTREDDPSVRQILPQFVMRMTRFVDHTARSIRDLDLPSATKTARSLGATAGNCGFALLAEVANALADACETPQVNTDAVADHLENLEAVAKRIQAAYPNSVRPNP